MPRQLLIIGANAAGLSAAMEARRRNPDIGVTVLEAGAAASWSNCDLPYNLADPERSMDDLVQRQPHDFLKRGIVIRFHHRVLKLNTDRRQVEGLDEFGAGFQLSFDQLIVATGAGAAELPGVLLDKPLLALRSLDEARRLKAQLAPAHHVTLIGGGAVALEVVDALCDSGRELTIIEASPGLLAGWPSFVGEGFAEAARKKGHQLFFGSALVAVQSKNGIQHLTLASGQEIVSDLVIHCAGIRPRTSFLKESDVNCDAQGRIIVNREQQTSVAGIWAAGDCCLRESVVDGRHFWNPQALDARRAGRVAGANAGASAGLELPPGPGTMLLHAYNLQAARCGQLCPAESAPVDRSFWSWSTRTGTAQELRADSNAPNSARGLLGGVPANSESVHDSPSIKSDSRYCLRSTFARTGHVGNKEKLQLQLECTQEQQLSGCTILSEGEGAQRINVVATLLHNRACLTELESLDLAYTPRHGPAVDPLIQGARQLMQQMKKV